MQKVERTYNEQVRFNLLEALDAKGPLSSQQLAQHTLVPTETVCRVIRTSIHSRGHIEVTDDGNAHRYVYQITEAGKAWLRKWIMSDGSEVFK
jgi:predicted transcriptional regulator